MISNQGRTLNWAMDRDKSNSFQTSSCLGSSEFCDRTGGQSSSSTASLSVFRNNQNLSTTPSLACVSLSALQPLAFLGQVSSSCVMSSVADISPTLCRTSNCLCASSSPVLVNSLIPSPFSSSSFSSFFPAHVAQQCSFMPCSSSRCSNLPSLSLPHLIQLRRNERSEPTTITGSPSSSPAVVRLSSLASLASALQTFPHSSKGIFTKRNGDRDREEDESVQLGGDKSIGTRRKLKQHTGSGFDHVTAIANLPFSRKIASFFQQLPRELDGFQRPKFGLALASTGAKQRKGIDSLKAQLPNDECSVSGNDLKDCSQKKNETRSKAQTMMTNNKKRAIQTSQHLLAGAIAAMVSRTIVAPLERLKLEYLVRGAQGSVLNTVQMILTNEGVVGFWKGNGMNLLRTAPFKSVNFFCYDLYRNHLLKLGNRKEVTNLERLAAGAAAGVTATILCFPLDTIRTTMVAPGGEALGGMIGCVKHMLRTEGFLSFYKGLLPAIVSMAPSGAVFYGVYDMLKIAYLNSPEGIQMLKARKKKMREAKERGEDAWIQPELGPMRTLLFGAIAGACAESVTYPFEVVRRAQQLRHAAVKLGMTHTFQMLLQRGGVKALYAGLFPSTLQVLPSAAFSYFVYETMKIAFKIP